MRIKISLSSSRDILLPRGYNEWIQALIYHHIEKSKANWLHKVGFQYEKRKFSLFVFSDILEKFKYDRQRDAMNFGKAISLYVASPVDWILQEIAQHIMSAESLFLGNTELVVQGIEVLKSQKPKSDTIRVRTLSPIEVHSTAFKADGGKKTYYYNPFEKEFSDLVAQNLRKKWTSFYENDCPHSVTIEPRFRSGKEKIRYFGVNGQRTLIKGWSGFFELQGNPELIQFALDAGLGSRNSQGYGMVEIVEKRESMEVMK